MIKKTIAVLAIVCVMVAVFASTCFAGYSLLSFGLLHGEIDGHQYEQAYATVSATDTSCSVTLSVRKGNVYYGTKTTNVGPGRTRYCTSYQVGGTGGYESITIS